MLCLHFLPTYTCGSLYLKRLGFKKVKNNFHSETFCWIINFQKINQPNENPSSVFVHISKAQVTVIDRIGELAGHVIQSQVHLVEPQWWFTQVPTVDSNDAVAFPTRFWRKTWSLSTQKKCLLNPKCRFLKNRLPWWFSQNLCSMRLFWGFSKSLGNNWYTVGVKKMIHQNLQSSDSL